MEIFALLLILPIIVIIGFIILWVVRSNQRKQARNKETAAALGFRPIKESNLELQLRIELLYRGSSGQRFELRNVFRRTFPDGEIYLFDLQETSGGDISTLTEAGMAIISPHLQMPWFSLFPKLEASGTMAALANSFLQWAFSKTGQPIEFSIYPEFDSRYIVTGVEPTEVEDFFEQPLIDQLAKTQNYAIMAGGDAFVFDQPQYLRQKAGDDGIAIRDSLNKAMQLYTWFSSVGVAITRNTNAAEQVSQPTHCQACGGELRTNQGKRLRICQYCGTSVAKSADQVTQQVKLPTPPSRPNFGAPVQTMTKGGRISKVFQSGFQILFALAWIVFSGTFVIVGAGFFLRDLQNYNLLTREGAPTQATITDVNETTDSDGDTSYYVSYDYLVLIEGDPTTFSGQQSVPQTLHNRLEYGARIDIIYANSNPSLSELQATFGPPDIILPACFVGMGGLFVLIGVAIIVGEVKENFPWRKG